MPEIISALQDFFESLYDSLGPTWTVVLIIGTVAAWGGYRGVAAIWRHKREKDRVADKDAMIDQLRKHNDRLFEELMRLQRLLGESSNRGLSETALAKANEKQSVPEEV